MQVVDDELHVLGILARQPSRHQLQAAAVAPEREVGVEHAGAVIHVHIVILVKGPVAIADYRLIAEETHLHLVVGEMGVATHAIACLSLDVLLVEHEVHGLALETSVEGDLGKIVPCAGPVTHVGSKSQVLVVQLMGLDGDGVDVGLTRTDSVRPAVNRECRVAVNLATDVAEVHLVLLQIALHDTVGAHVHVKVKLRHRGLEALDIDPSLIHLALDLISRFLEVLEQ